MHGSPSKIRLIVIPRYIDIIRTSAAIPVTSVVVAAVAGGGVSVVVQLLVNVCVKHRHSNRSVFRLSLVRLSLE